MIHKLLKARLLIPSFVMMLAMIAVACGDGDDATKAGGVTPATAEAPATPKPAATSAPAGPEPTRSSAGAFREATATPLPAGAPAPTPTPRPAGPPRGEPKVETLVMAVDPAAGETNLFWAGTVDHHQQFDLTNEVLIDIDPFTNKWVPELAKSWEMSPDGTEFRFQLVEDVPWHTGANGEDWGEFTAADALHSWVMNGREDSLLGYVVDWREVVPDGSTILSDHEIILKLKNPNPDYPFYIAPSGAGLIMNKAQWDAGGDDAYEGDVIGTGPYRYTGREYGVNVTYELLPDHWRRNDPPPDFQKFELRWIKEAATRNAGLLAGEIHLTELTRDLADAAVADHGMKIIESLFPGLQYHAQFNLYPAGRGEGAYEPGTWLHPDHPAIDVRVREAFNRAIDVPLIIDTLFAGRALPSPNLGYYNDLPGWEPEWMEKIDEQFGYDPDKARALLAEAGYEPGELKFTGFVMNLFGFPEAPDLMQSLEVQLRDVGIELQLKEMEWNNFLAEWRSESDDGVGLWLLPASYKTVYAQLSLFYRSSGAVVTYADASLDEMFGRLQQSVDLDERDAIQREIGNYKFENYTDVPLIYVFIEFVTDPNVVDQWPFPGTDGANYGHMDLISACTTPEPCMN